jgi:hypothetical protein
MVSVASSERQRSGESTNLLTGSIYNKYLYSCCMVSLEQFKKLLSFMEPQDL